MKKFIDACKTLKRWYHKKAFVNRRMIKYVLTDDPKRYITPTK